MVGAPPVDPNDPSTWTDDFLDAHKNDSAPPQGANNPNNPTSWDDKFLAAHANDASAPPAAAPAPPQIGNLESFGRGAEQFATLGYAPQVNAAIESKLGSGTYQSNLTTQKSSQDAAYAQHPWMYRSGAVASIIPAALASVLSGGAPEEAAGVGLGAKAVAALKNSANLASVAGGIAKGTIGTDLGLGGALVQGAVYGSSQGDSLEEKAMDGVLGGLTGWGGSKLLRGVTYVGAEAGRAAYNKFFSILAGNTTSGQLAADAAHQLGQTIPKAAANNSILSRFGAKTDILNSIPRAAASTLAQTSDAMSALHGDVDPPAAGSALQNAVKSYIYGPSDQSGTSNYALDNIYNANPVLKTLSNSAQKLPLDNLRAVTTAATDDPVLGEGYAPTLKVVQQALSNPDGLTLSQMRALKTDLSDNMNFGGFYQDTSLNQRLLGKMYSALSGDMYAGADTIGGPGSGAAVKSADQQASSIYSTRKLLNSVIGTDPTKKPPANVFNNVAKLASVKSGNPAVFSQVRDAVTGVDADAWDTFGQGVLQKIAPTENNFTFGGPKGFNAGYGSISPEAKDSLFGPEGSNSGPRAVLEKISTLGQNAGENLDSYGINPNTMNFWKAAELAGVLTGGEGLRSKALALTGVGTALGRLGAEDVAAPLPAQTLRSKVISNIPGAQDFVKRQQFPGIGRLGQTAVQTAKTIGALGGANIGVAAPTYLPVAKKVGLLAVNKKAQDVGNWAGNLLGTNEQSGQAYGGRITRASGGKVDGDLHEKLVQRLMNMTKQAKKVSDKTTEPLLNAPDEAIVKALGVAQEAI